MVGGGTALVAVAALFWGLAGGMAGLLLGAGWDAPIVSFYRGAIGLLCVLFWLAVRPGASGLGNPRLWFWSAVAGLGVAGNFTFYFLSIDNGNVAIAATLMYCAPLFVFLISFALKLERPTALKWAVMTVVMLGVVLLTQVYDLATSDISPLGVGAGLLSGLSYAAFIFGFKYAAPHGSPQAILSIAFGVLVALLILPADTAQIIAVATAPNWLLFAGLGVLGAGLSFVLYVIGLSHTSPSVASIVAMVEPVTASLFGVVVLSETLAFSQMLGMGLILLAVTTLSVHSSAK